MLAEVAADGSNVISPTSARRGSTSSNPSSLPSSSPSQASFSMFPKVKKPVPVAEEVEPKKRTSVSTSQAETCLLVYSISYAVLSRVPFSLFTVYMIDELHFTYPEAARTLGLYCFGRLVGAHVAGMYPGSVTMLWGTFSGGLAWGFIVLFDQQWIFVASSFLLGFTETVTGVETMLKIDSLLLRRKVDETQLVFRGQFLCTCLGVLVAYMGGGVVYQHFGMDVVGLCCIGFTCINLVVLAFLFTRRRVYRQFFISLMDIQSEFETANRRKSRASVAGRKVKASTRVSTYNIDAIELCAEGDDVGDSGKPRSMNGMPAEMTRSTFLSTIVAHFFFTTMGISTQFAISALYWKKVWGVDPDVAGTIMGIGESAGVVLLMVLSHPTVFDSPVTRYFGKPVHVLNCCLGIGIMCFLITADSKIACALGSVGIHMLNVCIHSFQSELVGICASGERFAKWISLSYVAKRFANCTCVFASILFFDRLGPQASYWMIGSGLILWAGAFYPIYGYLRVLPCQFKEARSAAAVADSPKDKSTCVNQSTQTDLTMAVMATLTAAPLDRLSYCSRNIHDFALDEKDLAKYHSEDDGAFSI